jgi:hypothetical protein
MGGKSSKSKGTGSGFRAGGAGFNQEAHMRSWVGGNVTGSAAEKKIVFGEMKKFVGAHPEVIKRGDSYSDIRSMAMRGKFTSISPSGRTILKKRKQ